VPRRAARIDANHAQIVRALRDIGASVESLASQGRGCPDLLVGFRSRNLLLEVKDGAKPPSAQVLTPDEQRWHRDWRGDVIVVRSVDEALKAIGVL
jgi:hypothetical protein